MKTSPLTPLHQVERVIKPGIRAWGKVFVLLLAFTFTAFATEKPESYPKTISLGEIRIQGDTEHPTINFLIPRIRIDFLDKKDIIQEIAQPVKSDIFEVK
ncbi:MAG: hypothetical protein WCK42_09330 [Myxococcaceae bacterium]